MPRKIIFSIMKHTLEASKFMDDALAQFSSANGIDIQRQEYDYETGRSDFVSLAVHGGGVGPDISEMGTTWINDFVAMNSLRPLSAPEYASIGGDQVFGSATWKYLGNSPDAIWAIPWMIDLSIFYYRKDKFSRAGIDTDMAFSSPASFEATLARLQASGEPIPWAVPNRHTYVSLHNLAMWVWASGHDFIDASGGKVLLDQIPVREAIISYFSLIKYLPSAARNLMDYEVDDLFTNGQASTIIGGPWLMRSLKKHELWENFGLALPFGKAYLGGSSLIIWQKAKEVQAILSLVKYLTGAEFQNSAWQNYGLLPVRGDSLNNFILPDNSMHSIIRTGLETGKPFPSIPLWGLVEERLTRMITNIWMRLLETNAVDVRGVVEAALDNTQNRLAMLLSER